jgi:alpha-tubulin suppressor-like RCC1 family protein
MMTFRNTLAPMLLLLVVGCADNQSNVGDFHDDAGPAPDAALLDSAHADTGVDRADSGPPTDAGDADDYQTIATGFHSTCAVTNGGTVYCWGRNEFGQLGIGSTESQTTPVQLGEPDSPLTAISLGLGGRHSCALRPDGSVACWGWNPFGQLGDGTLEDRHSPVTVIGLPSDVVQVVAGNYHSCVRTELGGVWCWGNENGVISGERRTSPVEVAGLTDVRKLAAGAEFTCALRASGTVACWGSNSDGQLGDGTMTHSAAPVDVEGITDARDLATGASHTCVLHATGMASCWGQDFHGQVGDGVPGSPGMNRTTPVAVIGSGELASIVASFASSCAIRTSDGRASCWGSNESGQLGDDSTADRAMPTSVSGLDDAVALSTGMGAHHCALRSAGEIVCWGANTDGQIGDGTTEDRHTFVPVAF